MQLKVAVIGAGPSGITALKNLLDQGIPAVAFDRNEEVGGNWIYSEKESHSSVFETTPIISSKTLSQYEDFTFDECDPEAPDYLDHHTQRGYFQAYAEKFNLYPHIQLSTQVKHCKWIDSQTWEITTEKNGLDTTGIFTHLVVSNGHHWKPRYPNYQVEFSGEFLHYWLSHPFFDKNFIDYSEGPVPLYLKMFHPDYCNLYFIGMFQPLGCIWPGAELQSKLRTQELMGNWKRPKNIRELCEKEVTHPHYRQVNSPRHTITVDYHLLMKALRKALPKSQVSKIPKQNMDSEMVST